MVAHLPASGTGMRNLPAACEFVVIYAIRAFSGKVGTGFPQKMRQIKNLDRFPIQPKRKAV
jgi:hypothetical protein